MTMTGYVELLGDPDTNATPAKRQEMLEYARKVFPPRDSQESDVS